MTKDPAGTRISRRAEERAKARKQRLRLVVAGGMAVVVLIALVTVVLIKGSGTESKKDAAPVRTQRTVLFQVTSGDTSAVASALLAHDAKSASGSVVLVQPQVLANVPGVGNVLFGKAQQTGGVAGARNALADLMGVTIDGSWVLDSPTFVRLLDLVGGISVTVDTTVLSGLTVVLQPGQQQLSGAQALTFATYLGAGEQEQTRLTRLQSVFDALLGKLPKDTVSLLRALGKGSTTSLDVTALATVLNGLNADDDLQNLQYRSLPVTKVDVDETQRFRIDAEATRALVDDLLSQSIPPGSRAEGNRVLVLNGVGTPGLGDQVRAKLVPAGFVYVGSRNAPSFGFTQTQVLVPDATTEAADLGARVARALGVPASSVKSSTAIGTIADVVVIVGADFKAK